MSKPAYVAGRNTRYMNIFNKKMGQVRSTHLALSVGSNEENVNDRRKRQNKL